MMKKYFKNVIELIGNVILPAVPASTVGGWLMGASSSFLQPNKFKKIIKYDIKTNKNIKKIVNVYARILQWIITLSFITNKDSLVHH